MPSKPKPAPKRERDITLRVVRDPGGAVLQRDRAPVGLRTPNGFVWGHQVNHLVWMPRVPGTNALTVWSRSMLKALGEGPGGSEELERDPAWAGEPLVPPRVLRPWPVLKLAGQDTDKGKDKEGGEEGGEEGKTLCGQDEGCEHEHVGIKALKEREGMARASEDGPWQADDSEPEEAHVLAAYADLNMLALLGECPDDPEELCTGPILFNRQQVKNPPGERYSYVWCEHFREQIVALPDPQSVVVFAVAATGNPNLDADTTGIWVRRTRRAAAGGEGSAGTMENREAKAQDEPRPKEDKHPSGEASSEDSPDVVMSEAAVSGGDEGFSNGKDSGNSASETTSTSPRDPYAVEGLPKLEEFIPVEFLPDVLMVHDPDNTTRSRKPEDDDSEANDDKEKPIMYKRYYPSFADLGKKEKENVAHLHLRKANRLGVGNHSHVYRAPLTLPPPLTASSPSGQVTVAAKLAYHRCSAHHLLHNEARVYDSLPKDMQEDWCGYNVVPQCRYPVPVGATAPKFFGYYLPVGDEGKPMKKYHPSCIEERPCDVKWASPILLMEECGSPVEPSKFTLDQRTECFSLILRLHHVDIVQGSFYVRNIMCQPGPLTLPPERRSYDTPSFRIIDFGRGKCWDWELEKDLNSDSDSGEEAEKKKEKEKEKEKEKRQEKRDERRREFRKRVVDEVDRAREELLVPDFAF